LIKDRNSVFLLWIMNRRYVRSAISLNILIFNHKKNILWIKLIKLLMRKSECHLLEIKFSLLLWKSHFCTYSFQFHGVYMGKIVFNQQKESWYNSIFVRSENDSWQRKVRMRHDIIDFVGIFLIYKKKFDFWGKHPDNFFLRTRGDPTV